jgi:two-component system phosphate regulon sensor histidine kinase PhoR
MLSLAQLN